MHKADNKESYTLTDAKIIFYSFYLILTLHQSKVAHERTTFQATVDWTLVTSQGVSTPSCLQEVGLVLQSIGVRLLLLVARSSPLKRRIMDYFELQLSHP